MRHERNVVSSVGHFNSFLFAFVSGLLLSVTIVFLPEENVTQFKMMEKIVLFFAPSIVTFLFPLIQTIWSHRLLHAVEQWWRNLIWNVN